MRARHPRGHHLVSCSGPHNCEEYFSILHMRPHEYSQWLTEDMRLRATASQRHAAATVDYPPPDPYAPALAAMRQSIQGPAPYNVPTATSAAPCYEPPDSYGLKRGDR